MDHLESERAERVERKPIKVRVTPALWKRIQHEAIDRDMTMQDLTELLLSDAVARLPPFAQAQDPSQN